MSGVPSIDDKGAQSLWNSISGTASWCCQKMYVYFWGKRILIVGPTEAGKTSLCDYLRYRALHPPGYTQRTISKNDTGAFLLSYKESGSVNAQVKCVVELPGHVGPIKHAQDAFDRKPHAIIVVTDLTAPSQGQNSSAVWVQSFFEHLELQWAGARRVYNPLQFCAILLNKMDQKDKVGSERLGKLRYALRRAIGQNFKLCRGETKGEPGIYETLLVDNPEGAKLIDAFIFQLIQQIGAKR